MTKKITFISDIHGDIDGYLKLVDQSEYSYQVGDLFYGMNGTKEIPDLGLKHRFIAGNHDHPSIYDHPNCLGKYLSWDTDDFRLYNQKPNSVFQKFNHPIMFSISGAETPLHEQNHLKKDGKWWPEEQLSHKEMICALDEYSKTLPQVVISHDAPDIVKSLCFKFSAKSTLTSKILNLMYKIHQPTWWIFGHWHRNIDRKIGNTNFVCRDIMGTFELEI